MEHRPPIRLQTTPVADHLRHHRYPVCDACGTVIFERYFVRVAEKTYHERCLRCCICRVQLSASCYYKHNQFYCKIDYQRYVRRLGRGRELVRRIYTLCVCRSLCVRVSICARLRSLSNYAQTAEVESPSVRFVRRNRFRLRFFCESVSLSIFFPMNEKTSWNRFRGS